MRATGSSSSDRRSPAGRRRPRIHCGTRWSPSGPASPRRSPSAPSSVLHEAAPTIAGRTFARTPLASVAPPEARAEWMAPINSIHPREFEVSVLIGGAAVLPAAMDPQNREQAPARRAAVAPEDGQSGRHARPQDRARDLPAGRAARAHGRGNHRSSTVRRTAAAVRRHAVASRRSRRTRRGQALESASPRGTRTILAFGEPDRRRRRIRVPRPGHARHARHARRRNGSRRADDLWQRISKDASSSSTSNGSAAKADGAQS